MSLPLMAYAVLSSPLLSVVLGEQPLDDPPNANQVKPGVILFVVIGLLVLATVFLWRNMRKQIGKINLPDDQPDASGSETAGAPEDPAKG